VLQLQLRIRVEVACTLRLGWHAGGLLVMSVKPDMFFLVAYRSQGL